MVTILLIVIFSAFIGIGLPDSALGTAWPAIYAEFGLPLSAAGYISAIINIGTIISSLLGAYLIKKLGTGLLTALCTALTALSLLGYALAPSPIFFFVLALPLGLGAGSVDTALNNFVTLHYSASQMSFLHCFYGIGVAITPLILSLTLGENENWRRGYLIVALAQFIITLITVLAIPVWKRVQDKSGQSSEADIQTLGVWQILKMPMARLTSLAFLSSCAFELTIGAWCSSYFVNSRNLDSSHSAQITMLFYIGLALGRVLSGLVAERLGRRKILKLSLVIMPAAMIAFMLPLSNPFAAAALFAIGLGVGPVFPNLTHLTPKLFGKELCASVIGAQQAMTYIGILIAPWLFGVLADKLSTALLPFYIFAWFVIYAITMTAIFARIKREKRAKQQQNI